MAKSNNSNLSKNHSHAKGWTVRSTFYLRRHGYYNYEIIKYEILIYNKYQS